MAAISSIMTQFDRVLSQPLETNSVFGNYEAASNYATTSGQVYTGQVVRVLDPKGVIVYVIEEDRSLKRLGAYYGEFIATDSPMVIDHNQGRCPEVIFVDESGNRYEVEVSYPTINQVKVTWNNPNIRGKIYII